MAFISLGSGAAARGLPVYLPVTEAAAAAAPDPTKTFVCQMKEGASTNETGVGGVTGADLVLTQFGGLAGVSSGFRQVNTGQGLDCTAALLAALMNGPEWSMMFYLSNVAYGASANFINYIQGVSVLNLYMTGAGYWAPQGAGYLAGSGTNMSSLATATPASNLWAALWRKGNHMHFGFSAAGSATVAPTGWDYFPALQRSVAINCGNYTGETWGTYRSIIGYSTTNTTFKVGTIVISKIGLQAAPV